MTRPDVTLEVFSAPPKDLSRDPRMKELVKDASDDESDNQESFLWWRSIGNITPQPGCLQSTLRFETACRSWRR